MFNINNAILLIIDVQEKLTAIINENRDMLKNIVILGKCAKILDIPVINCRQYPQGLGETVKDIIDAVGYYENIDKVSFSCCGEENFTAKLKQHNRKQIVLCGIETHVCVYQTAMELMALGFEVGLVADAVSSRIASNKTFAISRLESEGAKIYTTEMIIFELLKTSKHPAFKEVSKLVK